MRISFSSLARLLLMLKPGLGVRRFALKELIAKYSTRAAYDVATVYAFRDQRDKAFEWLDRAYAQRAGSLAATNVDPLLKNLRGDPRYAAFLKKLGLPN